MWGLHRADGRCRSTFLRDPDWRLRGAADSDARRPGLARTSRSGAGRFHRGAGRAMRLLSQRHDHGNEGAAHTYAVPVRDRGAGGTTLQSVPLRRSCRNRARRAARRGTCRRGTGLMGSDPAAESPELLPGSLSVVRLGWRGESSAFETFIKITADGSVTAFNGHVDLGTGIRTALGQIVAEELDVSFARVVVVLGDTSRVPNQGATIASETIQITAVPLRKAAAQARQFLVARAAERLELAIDDLSVEDGLVRGRDNRSVSYGELIAGETIRLELANDVHVKAVDAYTIVGQSVPRTDLPAKATGELVYVHDVRVPGMLHGRVVRPPYAGVDAGPFVGTSLVAIDETSVSDIPGLVAVVREGDFVGVVAEREENAVKAAMQLKVRWKPDTAVRHLS